MKKMSRRKFIGACAGVLSSAGVAGYASIKKKKYLNHVEAMSKLPKSATVQGVYLRPPGALPEKEFLSTCIRCRRCSVVCPNGNLKYLKDTENPALEGTPYFSAREKACILCMKCTQACPSGALKKVADDNAETLYKEVKIGTAIVDRNICNSYNNYTCGVCIRACPVDAIMTETWERPVVKPEKCVGCGLCEQSCIHYPQAIRVIPKRTV